MTEDHPSATLETAAARFRKWQDYWDLSKPILAEKSPPTLLRTRLFQALFPNSRFLVLVRHPAAVALASLKGVSGLSLAELIEHWLRCHEIFLSDVAQLREVRVVKYESLIAAPEETLAAVTHWLSLSPIRGEVPIRSGMNEGYEKQWRWLTEGSPISEEGEAALQLEERVRKFGYSLRDWQVCEPFPEVPNLAVEAPRRPPTRSQTVTLVRFDESNAHLFRNLYPLSLHDLSAFDPMLPNEHGVLELDPVRTLAEQMELHSDWLTNPDVHPLLIQVDGVPAGFALIGAPPHGTEDSEYTVHEFFLLHAFRGKSVGMEATRLLFEQVRGQWELHAMPNNPRAVGFWRKALAAHSGGALRETVGTTPYGVRVRFRFNNGLIT